MPKKRKKKLLKREMAFNSNIERLDDRWADDNPLLILKNYDLGAAAIWKKQVYNLHYDACLALSYAYSNQHSDFSHRVFRRDGRIVVHSQVIIKAFYLRYCILLLQACGEKLAQVLRVALGIKRWEETKKVQIADEKNTNLQKIKIYLERKIKQKLAQREEELYRKIYEAIKEYLDDSNVRKVYEYANTIKHRWQLYYQGEGLQPAKPEESFLKDNSGKVIGRRIPILASSLGEDISKHIKLCLMVNNLFVKVSRAALDTLDIEKLYESRNGKRILRPGGG